jgi:hypothetical protein
MVYQVSGISKGETTILLKPMCSDEMKSTIIGCKFYQKRILWT